MDKDSKYRELGTLVSGYSEEGPFHCEDCIHLVAPNTPQCHHPAIVGDPDLQDRLVQIDSGQAVTISLEKGCCRYVKPPSVIALVLRHGDTTLNDEGRLRSRMDVPLSPEGQAQAQAAAQFITKNFPNLKRIYVAPLTRTQQTIAPVVQALGIEPEVNEAINTWDMGVLIGQKKDEVKDVLDHYIENSSEPIPQGESLQEHVGEMIASVEPLLEQAEEDGPILICMTSSSIIPLLKLIEGTSIEEPVDAPGIGPGGIMAISLEGDGYKMEPIFGEVKPAELGAS